MGTDTLVYGTVSKVAEFYGHVIFVPTTVLLYIVKTDGTNTATE